MPGMVVIPYIKVYGDVPQVWNMFFTSSGIYQGHKFKILSIVLGYHLPVVCICYGH